MSWPWIGCERSFISFAAEQTKIGGTNGTACRRLRSGPLTVGCVTKGNAEVMRARVVNNGQVGVRRPHVSARLRILGWSVGLLAVALLASTTAVHVLLNRRADTAIRQDLAHEIAEFRAEKPAEAAPAGGPVAARLLEGTKRAVPHSDIVLVALLNGRVLSVSGDTRVSALRRDAAQLTRLAEISSPRTGSFQLPAGAARYAAVPVRAAGDPARGTFIAAVLTGPEHARVWQVTRVLLEVGSAALILAAVLAWYMAGRVLRPVRETTNLAKRITDTKLSDRIPVHGSDEISDMARTFNSMLDRLHEAFATQRQFLADAGHELRTPITIIQGNLDTLTAIDPDDAETLAIVSDELARMTRLVDDLLLLASSEQPDFIRSTPTDLELFSTTLIAKVEALSARRWRTSSTLHGRALLDAQRITQAVTQLAANAIAHTDPDVQLDLRLSAHDELRFAVIDHGRGVPDGDRSRIFDRFVQLDQQHDRGTGLGLPIVAAIAAAHGGSIELTTTPGGGATFTLRVPRRPVPHRSREPRTAQTIGGR